MENIIYYLRKYCLYIIIFLILIICFLSYFLLNTNVLSHSDNLEVNNNEIKPTISINFDIKGAVNKPGVYNFLEGMTINDAIMSAGGLREDADTSTINLSKELKNEMVIIIYTKEEIKTLSVGETAIKVIEKECMCPKIENKACIDKNNLIDNHSSNNEVTNNGKININTADLTKLMTLSGIGESKAKAIIKYREDNGDFKTIDEITKVSGIGKSTFEKIKENITI